MTDPLLHRRRFLVAGIGSLLAACAGGASGVNGSGAQDDIAGADRSPSPRPSPEPAPSRSATASPSPRESFDITTSPSAGQDRPTGIVPTRVEIPAIGVDAPCIELNLTAQEVEVPEDFDDTGWWVQTRKPGEIGPAVIGGHVDSRSGPAVFFRLRDLRPGDEITVRDEAGETRTFVVDRDPIQVDKYERPEEVFGFTDPRPELRLITCGGDFNPAIGHYTDNIVVFAHDPAFEA